MPLVLRRTSPADNATNVAVSGNILLTFNEQVKAGSGLIKLHVSDGTLFHSIAASDTSQVTFDSRGRVVINPSVNLAPGTSYYVTIDPGALENRAGDDYVGISSTTAFNFTTAGVAPVDATAPLLIGTLPSDDTTNVPVNTNLVLTFNEAVKAGSGDVEIRNAATGNVVQAISIIDTTKITFSGHQLVINPGSDLSPETAYYVTLASDVVRDIANNPFGGISSAATFNFVSGPPPDTTAPFLTGSSPNDGSANVAVDADLVLTFNETIEAGTGKVWIYEQGGALFRAISMNDSTQVAFSGNTVTIDPNVNLLAGTNYYVLVGFNAVQDASGNGFAGYSSSTQLNFTTTSSEGDVTVPQLTGISPSDGATAVPVDTNIVLTFSESVRAGLGSIAIVDTTGAPVHTIDVQDTTQITFSNHTVTINPTISLAANTLYALDYTVFGLIQDLAGNGFGGLSSPESSFRTGAPPGLTLTGTNLSNTLTGGSGSDVITGLGRGDTLTGGGGVDTFVYNAVTDSTSRTYDTVTDFKASVDVFDFWFQVTGIDLAITSGSLSARRLDADLASTVGASKLAAHHAVLFTPSAGNLAGSTFLIVDANGTPGYQASADLVILLGAASSVGGLATMDFV